MDGHEGGTFAIKPVMEGENYFLSLGQDSCLKLWDLRSKGSVFSIPTNEHGPSSSLAVSNLLTGESIAAVGHQTGKVSLWDLGT
jgi:WD40 repeat protein